MIARDYISVRHLTLSSWETRVFCPHDVTKMSIPTGGTPLPDDAIQRILFVCNPVHVYAIPPLTSMKGYTAADWTTPDPRNNDQTRQIFTARLRIVETAIPIPARPGAAEQEKVTTDILLEDPNNGTLFAAAPYTDEGVVEHAVDSSRFFALRVMGDGRKAVLGIGFEDRSEAFDFGVTLQEARKVLGFGKPALTSDNVPPAPNNARVPPRGIPAGGRRGVPMRGPPGRMMGGNIAGRPRQPQLPAAPAVPAKPKDFSLKPGQTITVNLGGRQRTKSNSDDARGGPITADDEKKAFFSIAPPPAPAASKSGETDSVGAFPLIPPPPSAREASSDRRRKPPENPVQRKVFDDDDFGEFQ